MQAANLLKKKKIESLVLLRQCEAKDNAKAVHLLAVDTPANYKGRCQTSF